MHLKFHIFKGPVINNGRGAVGEKRGRLQLFLPELGAASNRNICDNSTFFNTFPPIFKIFKPFLAPIIVVKIVHHRNRNKQPPF